MNTIGHMVSAASALIHVGVIWLTFAMRARFQSVVAYRLILAAMVGLFARCVTSVARLYIPGALIQGIDSVVLPFAAAVLLFVGLLLHLSSMGHIFHEEPEE